MRGGVSCVRWTVSKRVDVWGRGKGIWLCQVQYVDGAVGGGGGGADVISVHMMWQPVIW